MAVLTVTVYLLPEDDDTLALVKGALNRQGYHEVKSEAFPDDGNYCVDIEESEGE